MDQKNLEAIMGLIINSGNAKAFAMEAIEAAKSGDFEVAKQKVLEAEDGLIEAHHAQTAMLTEEAKGNNAEITLLTVHSQDHLMTTIVFKDLANEIIDIYKKMN
jgi:cellobiose PTS system EIIA component